MSKKRCFFSSSSSDDSEFDSNDDALDLYSSSDSDTDSGSDTDSDSDNDCKCIKSYSIFTKNSMIVNNKPDNKQDVHKDNDSICLNENKIDVMENKTMNFDITKIECRSRKVEYKWTLGFNEYSLITRYINDIKSCVNFKRVCTRTNCMFNLPSNMGLNVYDPDDWKKLQTHIIHTDIEMGITDFIDNMNHKLTGNHLSFYKYFNKEILLYIGGYSSHYTLLYIGGVFPSGIVKLIKDYIKYKGSKLYCGIFSNLDMNSIDKDKLMEKFNSGTKFITNEKFGLYIKSAKRDYKNKLIKYNVYNMLQNIFSDIDFINGYVSLKEIPNFVYENYISFNTIDIPICDVNSDYIDSYVLEKIFKCSKLIRSFTAKTCIEDVSLMRYNFEFPENLDSNIDDAVKHPDTSIFVIQVESFIDKVEYHKTIGKDDKINRGRYTVIFLPTLLYNYIQVRYYDLVEPITVEYYYIKDTNIICGFNKVDSYTKDRVNLKHLIDCAKDIEGINCNYIKRFVVDVSVFTIIDQFAAIDKDFPIDHIKYGPSSLLKLKYGYKVPSMISRLDGDSYLALMYHLEKMPITSLTIQAPLSKILVPFGFKCVIKSTISTDVISINEHKVCDNDMYFYSHGKMVPYKQYLAHKAQTKRGGMKLSALVKTFYVVKYIIHYKK